MESREARRPTLFVFIIVLCICFGEALKCWVCLNQPDNEACIRNGHLEQCERNEKSCHNSVRRGDNGILVTKRCKQNLACSNNAAQNDKPAWSPTQCNHRVPSSVCRCCCSYDECNKPQLMCPEEVDSNITAIMPTMPTTNVPTTPTTISTTTTVSPTTVDAPTTPLPPVIQSDEPTGCSERLVAPNHGQIICDRGQLIGSICTFLCIPGYMRVGVRVSLCGVNQMWSNLPPTCEKLNCPRINAPQNGSISCTEENEINSICTFNCDEYFYLLGHDTTTCTLGSPYNAMWSNIKPSCIRRTCDEAPVGRFTFVQCTDSKNLGSVCTYKCLTHHRLVGPASTQCIDDGGDLVWDSAAPNCEHIECPDLGTIANGNVICPLSTNYVNAVCYFTCNDEFRMEPDTSLTTCQNDSTWTDAKPTCLPITCSTLPSIQHGDASCTNFNLLHSVCTFTCDDEHMLHGSDSTTCGDNGEWTSPSPTCQRIVCTEQTKPANGSMSCNHGNNEGSVCSFECYSTHQLVGEFEIQCVTSQAGTLPVWSGETPSCILRKNCGSLPVEPVDGYVVCTDGIFLDSECEFACEGFRTRVGALYTMCVEDGGDMNWDNPTPVCERTQCPDQGSIANGTMSCTDGNYANSVCSYTCDNENYVLTPSAVVDNTCNNDTTWNLPKPCCSKVCPPYSVVDAVILLDSSSSIGNENWRTMKAFIRQVIDSFVIQDDAARLAIFRFNSQIDTRTQILLGDYPNDKQGLLRAFDRIPYDGEGTRTGAALNHARNVMLAPANGNRDGVPDSVFIITDGVSQDHVTTAANLLREQGVEVYAIGVVPPKGRLNRRQLMDIAGEPDNLVIAERGFDGLDQSLFEQIQQQICTEGCFEHLNLG